jgi:hypothetical protein
VIEFIQETLLLLPFLFVTYLVLEAIEAKAGSALESFLERARSVGPAAGALAGAIPQCGVSAAAASFYAGGVITVGTLIAVFLSTSDELIPVLISARAPMPLMVKIVGIKVACALGVGFLANGVLAFMRHIRREVSVHELCEHSHCGCHEHKGILVPALIHTAEIFAFIVIISGAIELCMHCFGEECLEALRLNRPFFGELAAGALGLIPNCAVSVAGAKLYLSGAMSPAALMASSFTGSGLGLLVLFRTNRNMKENLAILFAVYVVGVVLGHLTGYLL